MTQLDLFGFPSPPKKVRTFIKTLTNDEAKQRGLPLMKGDKKGNKVFLGYKTIETLYEEDKEAYDNIKLKLMWVDAEKKEKSKQSLIDRGRDNRAFLNRLKRRYGCSMCGWRVPEDKKMFYPLLHFDHIDASTKEFTIAAAANGLRSRLKLELRKCRILCVQCHTDTDNFGKGVWVDGKTYEHQIRKTRFNSAKWKT